MLQVKMNCKIKTMLMVFCILTFFSGCGGTLHTRTNLDGTFLGKPFYAAVVDDFRVTFYGVDHGLQWLRGYNMIKPFSFPMDFILDTVFLPFDLIAWSMGYDKTEE